MLQKIKNNNLLKTLFDSHNLGLYALLIIALSVTWSSVKIIQKNYELQKQITRLQQEVEVLDQQTKNQKLKNEYFKTDAYLDIAARKYFGKANPGEKVIVVPKDVALKYTHPEVKEKLKTENNQSKPKFVQNLQDWLDFFLQHQKTSQ